MRNLNNNFQSGQVAIGLNRWLEQVSETQGVIEEFNQLAVTRGLAQTPVVPKRS